MISPRWFPRTCFRNSVKIQCIAHLCACLNGQQSHKHLTPDINGQTDNLWSNFEKIFFFTNQCDLALERMKPDFLLFVQVLRTPLRVKRCNRFLAGPVLKSPVNFNVYFVKRETPGQIFPNVPAKMAAATDGQCWCSGGEREPFSRRWPFTVVSSYIGSIYFLSGNRRSVSVNSPWPLSTYSPPFDRKRAATFKSLKLLLLLMKYVSNEKALDFSGNTFYISHRPKPIDIWPRVKVMTYWGVNRTKFWLNFGCNKESCGWECGAVWPV